VPSTEIDPLVARVAAGVGLAEGTRGVQRVLDALVRLEPVSIRALARAVDLPVPIVAAICGELRRDGIVSETRPAQLTIAGRKRYASAAVSVEAACPACRGRGVGLPDEVARLRRGLARLGDAAPSPRVELDQCHCTARTKLRRVLALHGAGALGGRRILLLGDDDLISLALARFVRELGTRDTIRELAIVDVDERLLAFIGDELGATDYPVQLIRSDLRDPLQASLAGAFDTVVTDPPYTADGAALFLSRAVEATSGPGADVFCSFGSRRPRAQFELQRTIARIGLEIRALTRDFNDYVGAGVLGGTSHLYHLATTEETQPLVRGRFEGALYTAARRRTAATQSTSRRHAS
jgi:N4-bis(aminopropyl)spermidine synthase